MSNEKREEQIRKKAKELGQMFFPDSSNVWARENFEAKCVEAACIEMARWLDSHPQWIPVEEELPPKKDKYSKRSNEVLVITERKECFIAKYWYDGDGWAVSGFPTSNLTHWMPIVPPRKEE